MPAWLLNLLVSLAFKVGIPLLLTKFPWIPKEVVDILNQLALDLKGNPKELHADIKDTAKGAIKECLGVGCPTSLKQ